MTESTAGIGPRDRRTPPPGPLRNWRAGNILLVFLIIQVVCVAAALLWPSDFRYLAPANISVMLKAIPILGVVALGVGLLMVAGEFDLSVGSVSAFTAMLMSAAVVDGITEWVAAPGALVLGALIGLANGAITLRFAIPSFIVTLGAMLFWKGMFFLVHGAQAIRFATSDSFKFVMVGSWGFVEMTFVWFVVAAILFHLVLRHHRYGSHALAVGGNRQAAIAVGVSPVKVKLIAFAVTGATAALSGVLSATRVNSVTPAQGQGLELQAIAACVIGGVALTGGRGTVLGMVIGAALIYTIQDILLLMRAPGFYLDLFVGVLIVLAAIANQLFDREARR